MNKLLNIKQKETLTLEQASNLLSISKATLKNWIRVGYLDEYIPNSNLFATDSVVNLQTRMSNGSIKKLDNRANKLKSTKTFIPKEYSVDIVNSENVTAIVNFINENGLDLQTSIFLLSLNLLKKERILIDFSIETLIDGKDFKIKNDQIKIDIENWFLVINKNLLNSRLGYLLNCDLPQQEDSLGFIYQSILSEGQKSKNGSYYTPSEIVNEIVSDYVKKDSKVLDPCCGTGQFLLAFSNFIDNPRNIYGYDIDDLAVRIARLNILLKFKKESFNPNIECKNFLFDIENNDLFNFQSEIIKDFDFIATNPPWGAFFSKFEKSRFKTLYPSIKSFESFSYFLKKSLKLLKSEGVLSFVLPESILNVKTHKDIREHILESSCIKKIVYLDRVFRNVFTSVIRLDLVKSFKSKNNDVTIKKGNEVYEVNQKNWISNRDFIFNIHANSFDTNIIDKVYETNNVTLKNNADWALGIVTGNNKNFLLSQSENGAEPIYKGKDVSNFLLDNPSCYIQFSPENFQQVAPIERYRAKEKLIYRFISKNLIFAYDDKQQLTLNSANIVIPKIEDYPMKVIAALFNSSLYQFIFQKKFSSIKVLRGHIEQLPLPLWNKNTFEYIISIVDEIIAGIDSFNVLDDFIMNHFSLSKEEISYIKDLTK